MRVIKSLDQACLTRAFVVNGQAREAVSVIYGFDLCNSAQRLSEQEIWSRSMAVLGDTPLDAGMPKTQAEWLVCASAHALDGDKSAVRVAAGVDNQYKTLDIVGPRYWQKNGLGLRLTEAETFSQMPIRWHYASRGQGIDANPSGIAMPSNHAEGQLHAGIYYPADEILDARAFESPKPAGFMPLDVNQPRRVQCLGSYDEHWRQTQWPNFPSDFDPTFFNVAPEDQRLSKAIMGGEAYVLVNLHPEKQTIQGHIPHFQPRAFLRTEHQGQRQVQEVVLSCDTIWMLPDTNIGIVIFHGSAPISDEEGLDIQEVLLADEKHNSQPLPIEHYIELFDKAQTSEYIAKQLGVDLEPVHKAERKLKKVAKLAADGKKLQQFRIDQATGKAPTPQSSMANTNKVMARQIDDSLASLNQLKNRLALAPSHPEIKSNLAKGITGLESQKLALAEHANTLKDMQAKVSNVSNRLAKEDQFGATAEVGVKLDQLNKQFDVVPTWQAQASSLVYLAHQNVLNSRFSSRKKQLLDMGVRELYLSTYMLGWLDETVELDAERWQLDEPLALKSIPSGWVMIQQQDGEIASIIVRPCDGQRVEQDILLPGSKPLPWYSGLEAPVKLLVPDLLASWILAQDFADYLDVIWLSPPKQTESKQAYFTQANFKQPNFKQELSDELEQALSEASCVYLACPLGADISAWQQVFPSLKPLYFPDRTDVYQFHKLGIEPICWLKEHLPDQVLKGMNFEQEKTLKQKRADLKASQFYQAMRQHSGAQAKQDFGFDPFESPVDSKVQFAPVLAKHKSRVCDTGGGERYLKHFSDAEQRFADATKSGQNNSAFEFDQAELKSRFGALRTQLHQSQPKSRISTRTESVSQSLTALEQQVSSMLDETESLQKKVRKLASEASKNEQTSKLTREQVVQFHQEGHSLRGRDLSGLDLSELDLSGGDFQQALMNETNFRSSRLVGCNFNQVIADLSVFSKADISEASFLKAVLNKADFRSAVGKETDFSHATMVEASLSHAQLERSRWQGTMANKCQFVSTSLSDAAMQKGVFIEANFTAANLTSIATARAVFNDACFEQSDLRHSQGQDTIFWGIKASGSLWDHAIQPRARFGPAQLEKAIGRLADFSASCLQGTQLNRADFRGSNFGKSLLNQVQANGSRFDGCNFSAAQLTRGDFQSASFKSVNGMQASLFRSQFQHADLSQSNFYLADFRKVTIGNTDMSASNLDNTILQQGAKQLDE
ncbi:DUF2169 domain-containing protein [Vibrio profundum]|uniref:DUF2169 family type VI secretion system accessory protein n=1 Tax=Vibrio profundum TaxID=2910247 RepID=UPI003D0B6A51